MKPWGAALALFCVTLWHYPLGLDNTLGQAVQTTLELRICEGATADRQGRATGQRLLEAWRVVRLVDGGFVKEVMEVRLPWGSDAR